MKAVCGLDVHKDSIFLCILHSDGELFEQVFGVLTFQLEGYPMRGKSFKFFIILAYNSEILSKFAMLNDILNVGD